MAALVYDLSLGEKTVLKTWQFKDISGQYFNKDIKNRDNNIDVDIDAIQNSINNMFLFNIGERVIIPSYGNSLYKYLYEPINDMTAKKMGTEILQMFQNWEVRITIETIIVTPYPDENTFRIEIIYTIPSLGDEKLNFQTAVQQRRE